MASRPADENPGELRAGQLSPAQLDDFLPGAGASPDPYTANQSPARADELIDGAKAGVEALKSKALAHIDSLIDGAKRGVLELEAALTGPIDQHNQKTELAAQKLFGKMLGQADLHIGNALASAQSLGIEIPSPQDVAADLTVPTVPVTIADGSGADSIGGGGGHGWSPPPPPPCPDDRSSGGLAMWAYRNNITDWATIVACTTTRPDGFHQTSDGVILSSKDYKCPTGYHIVFGGGAFTTAWPVCAKDDTTNGGGGGGGGDSPCPTLSNLDKQYLHYGDGSSPFLNGVAGHDVFQQIDASTPPGVWDLVSVQYVDAADGLTKTRAFYMLHGSVLGVINNNFAYWPAGTPGLTPYPCLSVLSSVDTTVAGGGGGGACPAPPPADCATPPKPKVPQLGDIGDGVCVDFAGLFNDPKMIGLVFGQVLGMNSYLPKPTSVVDQVVDAVMGNPGSIVPGLVNRFTKWLTDVSQALITASGCNLPAETGALSLWAILEFLDKWFGVAPPGMKATVEQAVNNLCPYNLPEQGQADAAWLSATIQDDAWECWTKSAGNLTTPAAAVRDAGRTRPNAAELCLLYRRGLLDDAEFKLRLREVGVLKDAEGQNIFDLTQFLPGPADIVRFMVRDVGDPDMVKRFGLDAKFEEKIKGNIVLYAKANGLNEETLLDFWRAHWVIPAYTQLVDMMFRLRPGRVPAAIEVTEDDVRQALNHNDVLPFWVDRLMQLARPVLNRTDLLLAFTERTISDQEFTDGLQDLGYTPENAKRFLATYSRQRKLRDARASGVPTARRIVKQYADGLLTDDELRDFANQITVSRKQRDGLIATANKSRELAQRQCAMSAIKKQYVAGLIDDGTASAALAKEGIASDEIPELVRCWTGDRRNKGKLPGAAQLCKWRSQNLLGPVDQAAALRRMGWSAGEAAMIVRSCDLDNALKASKAADVAAKRAAADMRKAPSKLKAAEAAAQAELNREAKADIHFTEHKRTTKETTTPPVPADAADGLKIQVVDQRTEDLP